MLLTDSNSNSLEKLDCVTNQAQSHCYDDLAVLHHHCVALSKSKQLKILQNKLGQIEKQNSVKASNPSAHFSIVSSSESTSTSKGLVDTTLPAAPLDTFVTSEDLIIIES